jgi:hypothetical protein
MATADGRGGRTDAMRKQAGGGERPAGLPDVRDGLTALERAVLVALREAQAELGNRNVPTAMLYGRVAERFAVSVPEFQRALERMVGARSQQSFEVGGLRGRRRDGDER